MEQKMTQEERLDYLINEFKEDSGEDWDRNLPSDTQSKRRVLRSLMNIRMPGAMPADTIRVQDAYLAGRASEKGVVRLSDIKTVREAYGSNIAFADKLSVWQGDITRLGCDAIVNAANSRMLGCFVPMHTCIDNAIPSSITQAYNKRMARCS